MLFIYLFLGFFIGSSMFSGPGFFIVLNLMVPLCVLFCTCSKLLLLYVLGRLADLRTKESEE